MNRFELSTGAGGRRFLAAALVLSFIVPVGLAMSKTPSVGFKRVNLISDMVGAAQTLDPNMINAWGIANIPKGPVFIANNGSGMTSGFNPRNAAPPVVVVPASPGKSVGSPTGVVYNSTTYFNVRDELGNLQPSSLIFVTSDGQIAGYNPVVTSGRPVVMRDNSSLGANYTGAAIATTGLRSYLYVANFRAGVIERYDEEYVLVNTFTDLTIPAGFAPYNILNLNGELIVTYAQQDALGDNPVAGPGLGYVDVFDAGGTLVRQFAAQGPLNAPYGVALAPHKFGKFKNTLLIANTGTGTILAYDPISGVFLGTISDAHNDPLIIDGLRGLSFRGYNLVFSSGPNGATNGLVGFIKPL